MNTDLIDDFFHECLKSPTSRMTVNLPTIPEKMKATMVDEEGWVEWKLINGAFQNSDYELLQLKYKVSFPQNFIEWHRRYFFLDMDCIFFTLPGSLPTRPLERIIETIDYQIAQELIALKYMPFASEGNDTGPLVFDLNDKGIAKDVPIRVYNLEYGGEVGGLSEIIFSSFNKLLECITYYHKNLSSKADYLLVRDFLQIDPAGAGKTGADYWLSWSSILEETK